MHPRKVDSTKSAEARRFRRDCGERAQAPGILAEELSLVCCRQAAALASRRVETPEPRNWLALKAPKAERKAMAR